GMVATRRPLIRANPVTTASAAASSGRRSSGSASNPSSHHESSSTSLSIRSLAVRRPESWWRLTRSGPPIASARARLSSRSCTGALATDLSADSRRLIPSPSLESWLAPFTKGRDPFGHVGGPLEESDGLDRVTVPLVRMSVEDLLADGERQRRPVGNLARQLSGQGLVGPRLGHTVDESRRLGLVGVER